MHDQATYDYAIVRVSPKVEREEFINVGAIVSCPALQYLGCRIELNERRLLALDPSADVGLIRSHLETIERICRGGDDAGPMGQLSKRERFHWLVAPRSTMIQISPVHAGKCTDPEDILERLLDQMVRVS